MRIFISLLVLVVFINQNVKAQNEERKSSLSEIRKNKYQIEIGFRTFKSVFDNTASASIIFKTKFSRGKLIDLNSVNYLRTYLTLSSQIKFKNGTFLQVTNSLNFRSNIDFTLGFGLEKQFQNKRFVHYFGCDIYGSYFKGGYNQYYIIILNSNSEKFLYTYEKRVQVGVIPFLGLKYYFTSQFHLGVETGLSVAYYDSKFENTYYEKYIVLGNATITATDFHSNHENGLKINYLGIRNLLIGYSF